MKLKIAAARDLSIYSTLFVLYYVYDNVIEGCCMGIVHAEITLKNVKDETIAPVTVTAVVDTGSLNMVITEELRQKLGLGIMGERTAHIADGQRITCKNSRPFRGDPLGRLLPACGQTGGLNFDYKPCTE